VLVGSAAFSNAREPLAQTFKPKGAPDATTFGVIVNHFKSKGSGVDDGTGQGNANPDRVAQAEAVAAKDEAQLKNATAQRQRATGPRPPPWQHWRAPPQRSTRSGQT